VFRFGTEDVAEPSASKAPRLLKPGEIVYSSMGSPIQLSRVPEKSESIPVTDTDGKV
jgi:hypothetical protein